MSVENLITEHLDIWTSAIKTKSTAGRGSSNKLELVGIKKLRELILELAVRGKLVPQDPNDEPASELLKKIEVEKARFVKEGKIKKQKPLPLISDEEKPFELPDGWLWERLGNLGLGFTGKTPSTREQKYFEGNIPFIGPGQITPSGLLLEPDKYLSEEGLCFSTEGRTGDILMVCIGGSIGKSVICDKRIGFNQQINMLRPLFLVPKYLNSTVSSDRFYRSVLAESTGSATPIINRSKWEELLVPVCSLIEQHRIVAKVDELMALCDQLETQTESSIQAHQVLVETLLATLSNAKKADELNDYWQTITQHFDVLFTTQDSIDQLKQTILQLAVMGKLVKQDPNDEPASKLLERIAAEKQQLIKDGKIKKQKPLPPITNEEKPFELPEGWEWQLFGNLSDFINGDRGKNYPNREEYVDSGVPWINTGHIETNGTLSTKKMNYVTEEKYDSLRGGKVKKGDLVYCLRGATFGKTAFVEPFNFGAIASSLMIIRPHFLELGSYIYRYLISPFGRTQIFRFDNGSAQPNLSANSVGFYHFPLPPLCEQRRIVAKVDELMTLCDSLKANLNQAQTTQLQLTNAMTEQSIN